MAMLITRFHRLIQNKFIWIAFSIIVVLSFVVWGTQSVSPSDYQRQFAAGELHGVSISQEEFNDAKFASYLSFLLNSGSPVPYNSRIDEMIRPMAWRRLASLQLAEQLGLVAGDREVFNSLLQEPSFQTEGQFDQAKYEEFLNQQLGAILQGRVSKQRFERHIREELSLGKLRMMLQQTALVPPYLARQAYHRLNDEHNILIAIIRREPLAETADVSEEDARIYFDANPDAFRLPERRVVAYARIEPASVLDQIEVAEADIEAYYRENLESYAVETEGESNAVDAAATESDPDETPSPRYRLLDEVRDEIAATLRKEAARVQALDLANDIVYELQPDQFGRAPGFAELLAQHGLTINQTEPFSRADRAVEGIPADVAEEFVDQTFMLYQTPDEYYGNPIVSEDAVFVVALREVIEPEVPAFEDVREDAMEAAEEQAVQDALEAKAAAVRTAMEEAAREGADVAEAVSALEVETSETGFFSVSEGLDEEAYARPLRRTVGSLNVGEVSDPLPAGEDLAVGYVLDRKTAGDEGFLPFKDTFEQTMRFRYAAAMLNEWQDHLLEQAGFVDRFAAVEGQGEGE